jgi:hypothetical protein
MLILLDPKGNIVTTNRAALDLLDYIERQQARMSPVPGMFSPDYRKAKKMLGLE